MLGVIDIRDTANHGFLNNRKAGEGLLSFCSLGNKSNTSLVLSVIDSAIAALYDVFDV